MMYTVSIYPQPYEIEVEAKDKSEAEDKAMYNFNNSNYQDILKVSVKKS